MADTLIDKFGGKPETTVEQIYEVLNVGTNVSSDNPVTNDVVDSVKNQISDFMQGRSATGMAKAAAE